MLRSTLILALATTSAGSKFTKRKTLPLSLHLSSTTSEEHLNLGVSQITSKYQFGLQVTGSPKSTATAATPSAIASTVPAAIPPSAIRIEIASPCAYVVVSRGEVNLNCKTFGFVKSSQQPTILAHGQP